MTINKVLVNQVVLIFDKCFYKPKVANKTIKQIKANRFLVSNIPNTVICGSIKNMFL